MAGDAAAEAAVPGSSRGVASLDEARVSRHVTERQAAESATWRAWGALGEAWASLEELDRRLLTDEQQAARDKAVAAVGAHMEAVLACGQQLLATDETIAQDALRVAR